MVKKLILNGKTYDYKKNEDGTEELTHIDSTGFKVTARFLNDEKKHKESMEALAEFYIRAGERR